MMKEHGKRWSQMAAIALVCMLGATVTLFAGGGQEGKDSGAAKTVLRFFNWQLTEEVNLQALRQMKEIYEKAHPNIQIDLEEVAYSDKNVKFVIASQGGSPPDVQKWEMQDIISHISKGYLLSLDPFIAKEPKGFLDGYAEASKKMATYKGHMYAMSDTCQTIILCYNQNMFRESGLDPEEPPITTQQFQEQAIKLTKDTNGDGLPDQWGFGFPGSKSGGNVMRFSPIFWTFGGDYLTEQMDDSLLNKPGSIAALKWFVELYSKYMAIPPGPTDQGPQDIRVMLAQKKVGMMFGSAWTKSECGFVNPEVFDFIRAAAVPVNQKKVTFGAMDFWAISAKTKHPTEAWEFVKFLAGEEAEMIAFKANGVISANLAVANSPAVKADKFASVVVEQIPYARALPQYIAWDEVQDAFLTHQQEAVIGQKTPEQALSAAHEAVTRIIQRYKAAE